MTLVKRRITNEIAQEFLDYEENECHFVQSYISNASQPITIEPENKINY